MLTSVLKYSVGDYFNYFQNQTLLHTIHDKYFCDIGTFNTILVFKKNKKGKTDVQSLNNIMDVKTRCW